MHVRAPRLLLGPMVVLPLLVLVAPGPSAQVLRPVGIGVDLGSALRSDRARTDQATTPLIVLGLALSAGTPDLPGSRVALYTAARGELGTGRAPGDRYRFQPTGEARAFCLDTRTGAPAPRGDCIGSYGGVTAEAGAAVPVRGAVVRLGAGYRFGMGPGPVGVVTVSGSRILYLRAEAGPRGGALVFGLGTF